MMTNPKVDLPDLSLSHLRESTSTLKKSVEEAAKIPEKDEPNLDDPKLQELYTFTFSWTSPTKKVFEGRFTTKILSIAERQLSGAMRSRMAAGVPFNALDPLTDELNLIISHLAFSLVEKPTWAEDLRETKYPALLQAIYEEVAMHEATFLGWTATVSAGEKKRD